MSKIERVIFITSLLLLVLYSVSQLNAPSLIKYIDNNKKILNWVDIERVFNNAGNGDLIFLSGNTKGEKTCKWCTNSIYSHVGILFREIHEKTGENILYIWDSDLGQKTKDGPRVMKLADKLKLYKGDRYLAWRKLSNKPTTKDILKVINKYSNLKFDDNMVSWFFGNKQNTIYDIVKDRNTVFCSELTAMTLQYLDILDKSKNAIWYSPGEFAKYNVEGLKSKYSYSAKYFSKF